MKRQEALYMPVDPADIAILGSVDIPHNRFDISRFNFVQNRVPNPEQKGIVHFRNHSVQEGYCFVRFKGWKTLLTH